MSTSSGAVPTVRPATAAEQRFVLFDADWQTSSSLNRLDIYAALKIPEVWRFDGENLFVLVLGEDVKYRAAVESRAIPGFNPEQLATHLARRNEFDELSWLRESRSWVRRHRPT